MVMRVCVPDDVAAGSYRLLFRTSGTDSANREIRDWLPTAVGGEKGNHYVLHRKHCLVNLFSVWVPKLCDDCVNELVMHKLCACNTSHVVFPTIQLLAGQKKSAPFWTFEYYQTFFDVDTYQVSTLLQRRIVV